MSTMGVMARTGWSSCAGLISVCLTGLLAVVIAGPVSGYQYRPDETSSVDDGSSVADGSAVDDGSAVNDSSSVAEGSAVSGDSSVDDGSISGPGLPRDESEPVEPSTTPVTPPDRPDDLVVRAEKLSKTAKTVEQYTEVIMLCDQALADGPSQKWEGYAHKLAAWAHNRRGEMRAGDGEDAAAIEDFEASIRHDPKRWQAIHNRGVSHAMQGQLEAAIADFDLTIKLNPNYANAHFNRGELLYEQGAYEAAINDYNRALRLAPRDSSAYNSRGHAYYKLGNYRQALADYSYAIRLDPQNAAAYTNRGDAYGDIARFEEAARDYRAAIRIDPKLGRAYQSAAWLMATCPREQYRNAQYALMAANKAIELDGEGDYRYLDTLAAAQANAGKFDEAKATEQRVVEMAPPDAVETYKERLALYEAGQPYRDTKAPAATAGDAAVIEAQPQADTSPRQPPNRRRRR
ncbi:MAG: tetratricopeptide repeat protein [Pirellulales bacterium]|nr:tetratricopeptide repeat protein [Pirellulales bacterium]